MDPPLCEPPLIAGQKKCQQIDQELVTVINHSTKHLDEMLSSLEKEGSFPGKSELENLVRNELEEMRLEMEREEEERRENEELVVKRFEDGVNDLARQLEQEKEDRAKGEEEILEVVRKVGQDLEEQIREQAEERERNEENLLGLVEKVIERLRADIEGF